jgi:16S rRNA (guanine966-N2)-methyltransferase
VREATFNALASLDVLRDATVLDLFAGSGALGIEALSRGAAHCTFVDLGRRAIAAVRHNLDLLDLSARATVVTMDVDRYLRSPGTGRVDLALADPPYAYDGWAGLMDAVPAAVLVAESDHAVEPGGGWELVRSRRYGTTHVTILRASRRPDPSGQGSAHRRCDSLTGTGRAGARPAGRGESSEGA